MLYDQFGDKASIEEHYPNMKKWISYMEENFMVNHILDNDVFGDWCLPPDDPYTIHSEDPDKITSGALLSTSFFYKCLILMTEFAEMQGMEEDARNYKQLAQKIYTAYNDKFLNRTEGFYSNNSVTSNVLSLAFGLVPSEYAARVFESITLKTENEFRGHISTGLVGGMFVMRELSEHGRIDLAYKLATNLDYPSWGYMIEQGATTIWELWNGNTANPIMNSGNHVMLLGDLIIWFYEYLAGIKPDPLQPAFKHIIMKPFLPEGLHFVKASHLSSYGMITSEWHRTGSQFDWEINIPANTRATVYIPGRSAEDIMESGENPGKAGPIKFLRQEN